MILVGTDDGIYRWFEGSPWLTFHSLQGRTIVDLASAGAGVLAAIDDAGRLWETEDNGFHWREIPLPPGAGKATTLAVAGAPAAIVLATRPFGLHLRPVGAPLPERPGVVSTLLARTRRRLGAGGGTAVAEPPAPTSGESLGWIRLGTPEPPAGPATPSIRGLVKGSTEDSPWYASVAGAGLWRSDDGGRSWARCQGLPAEVYAIRPVPGQAGGVVLATGDGCWITADGGQTWNDASNGLERNRHLRAVEVRPDDPKHLLAGAAPGAPEGSQAAPTDGLGFSLFESRDGGKTWTTTAARNFPARLQYDTIDDIRWDPAAPGYAIIALGSGECWRTRSEGAWWEPIARQTRAARVLCAVD
jgi:photosystem II stability/assembly factor-like uncharacterized protein